jgi:hypothetical protein
MKKIIWLIVILVLVGCKGFVSLRDTHPELNRVFRVGIDVPGEYPYCRQYDEEVKLQLQMFGP